MCSYSSINGVYAGENAYLDTILKQDFGFQGFITSDWGGTHSTVASANPGMDMEMPDDSFFGAALKAAVLAGQVPASRLDDMVTRILREEFRFGLVDHPSADTPDAPAASSAAAPQGRRRRRSGRTTSRRQRSGCTTSRRRQCDRAASRRQSGRDRRREGTARAALRSGRSAASQPLDHGGEALAGTPRGVAAAAARQAYCRGVARDPGG